MIDIKLIHIVLVSTLVTFISILLLSPIAKKIGIVDRPSKRKNHKGNIPTIGGITIFLGVFISVFSQNSVDNYMFTIMCSSFFILMLGFVDDCYPLSVILRILIHINIVSLMIWFTGLKLVTIGHSFGFSEQIHFGLFSYPITILGIVFVTNAFNLMDGADGVTGGLSLLAIIGIFILNNNSTYNLISLALLGSLVPFLWFNLIKTEKIKIFLGDSGSLFLGYIIACLLLYETQVTKTISPTYALWIIAVPLIDVVAVIAYRLKKSLSLFTPDKNHLHHFLENCGLSKNNIFLSIMGLGLLMLLLGFLIEFKIRIFSLPIFLFLLFIYVWFRVFSKYSKFR